MILKVWDEATQSYKGIPSIKGETPYIGENGNWWIGGKDTGVAAGGGDVLGEDGVIKQEHLPQGYPYVTEEIVDILPETYFEDASGSLTTPLNLIVGNTYTVTYNGVDYVCAAAPYTIDEITAVVLGNMAVAGGTDTGEPFAVAELPAEVAAEAGAYGSVIALDGATSVTISIKGDGTVVSKLNNKYLDLEWLPTVEKGKILVDEIGIADFEEDENLGNYLSYTNIFPNEVSSQLTDGQTVYVRYDGDVYKTSYKEVVLAIGNPSFAVNAAPNTGEPFCIVRGNVRVSTPGYHTFCIYVDGTDDVYNTLPHKFMPPERNVIIYHLSNSSDGYLYKNGVKVTREELLSDMTKAALLVDRSTFYCPFAGIKDNAFYAYVYVWDARNGEIKETIYYTAEYEPATE